VLLVDLDPQANLTEVFGLLDGRRPSISDLLADPGRAGAEAVIELAPRVGLIPSSAALADLTWQLVREPDYEERLARVLAAVRQEVDYDSPCRHPAGRRPLARPCAADCGRGRDPDSTPRLRRHGDRQAV
jgi:AAA domain